jgi:hypothetical protein
VTTADHDGDEGGERAANGLEGRDLHLVFFVFA